MMGSRRCELCKTGKVRPMQLTPSQAVLVCDNHDCDYLFNSSPWDNVIVRNLSMHPLGTPVDAESWIRASNSSSSSSGVHSDIKSPLFSPASSLVSLTDKEVEFLLEKSYAPSRVSSASQCSSLGSSSWRKSAARGTREHGRSATKLGKRSGQVASALSINTAFDLPSEGMPAPRHSDTVTADTELEVVAKNEFFDMLEELDLDSPSVSKNQCSSDSDLGDLPPLDPWMKEEYKVTQSELGALGNIKSLQGSQEGKQFEGSVSFKGDMDKFSDAGVPFIPSAGSAFSQVPPSKVITPSCLAPVKEDMISDSLLQERGCDSSRGDVVETGDGTTEHDPLYAGALLADTQTSSPASSHGSEDSGYNEECRVLVSIKKPVKTQKDFGTPTQVLIAKDSGDFSFANVEEKVCTTNIKESSHPEEVIKYLIRPVSMSDMINVYEYNVLPAEVSPGKSEKSVNSFEKSTNALEVSPEGSLEKCSSEEPPMVASVRSSPVEQNAPQLIEDTGATVALHCPRNTHSLLKQKSSDSNDSETSVTQNGVALINAVSEQNHTKPCITSEVRKEGLETEIDNFRLLEEPITSLFDISGLELGENEREDSSHISTEITRFCDTRQSSEVFQLPSASEDAEKMDWSNEVLEKMLLEEHHDVLGSIAMGTSSDDNVGAGTVQEDYGIVCQSEKDKQSSSCDQSQIEKCPTLSENVSRVDVQGDMCINIRKPTSPVEDEMNIEMNSQDSSSLCPDMGSIDKAPCSPEKTQPIRRGPGRPRGRGRPKNKNKSVPSTDFTTSRGAPTSTKVGASLPAGYVRESRSRKRRNLETRANNMPKEEDWEGEYRNEEDSADIRKGISGLLPSSYLQLARGRKSSKWSGGAKTAMYNCSSVTLSLAL